MSNFCPSFGHYLSFSQKKHYERAQKNHWNFGHLGANLSNFRHYERAENYHWNISGNFLIYTKLSTCYPHITMGLWISPKYTINITFL